jgi:acetyltransferase-like isoleucine patch superfamily enzyme
MVDIAGKVIIGHNTTIAERVIILTHTNVDTMITPKGIFPDKYEQVRIMMVVHWGFAKMPGVTIGDKSCGAMSLVLKDVASG